MKMRIRTSLILAVTGLLVAIAPTGNAAVLSGLAQPQSLANRPAYVPGEVLVKFRSGTSTQAVSAFNAGFAVSGTRKLPIPDLNLVRLGSGQTVDQAVQQMKNDPNVEYVQPNYRYYPMAVSPNDTDYGQQWGLKNTGQTITNATYTPASVVPGDDIDAEDAWGVTTDCSSVVVAVVDEGVNYTHTDLAGNMWSSASYPNHGYDFVGADDGSGTETGTGVPDNDPMPVYGNESHGTHVAGIIAAVGNNGQGVTGVCWKAKIMSVRVLTPSGGTSATVASGINFAVSNGAKIINLSLGGSQKDTAISNAIDNAKSKNVVLVVAAGNDGVDNDAAGNGSYPCDDTQANLVCVAALDQGFNLATFSNYGATSVDVGAPGTNILSTFPGPVVTDDFASGGWNYSPATGGWGETTCSTTTGSYNMLVDPSGVCPPNGTYSASANDDVYKSFDLSGLSAAAVTYYLYYDLAPSDTFSSAAINSASDPFPSGTTMRTIPGGTYTSSSGGAYPEIVDNVPSSCLTASCTIGFNLTSNSAAQGKGLALAKFSIGGLQVNTAAEHLDNGTSMATPMVTGIAALVRAYNPKYTYADTVAALKYGGVATTSLSGKTTTGNAANAMGSLAYINPPTGISFTVK